MREWQAKHKIEVVNWDLNGDASMQRHFFGTFANAFKAEAGELGLHTRAFTVMKFIHFLITGQICTDLIASASQADYI